MQKQNRDPKYAQLITIDNGSRSILYVYDAEREIPFEVVFRDEPKTIDFSALDEKIDLNRIRFRFADDDKFFSIDESEDHSVGISYILAE